MASLSSVGYKFVIVKQIRLLKYWFLFEEAIVRDMYVVLDIGDIHILLI